MIDFSKLPLAPDPDPNRTEGQTQDMLVADGRAAFRCGIPIEECPPFRLIEMAVAWRNGWRWAAKEEQDAKKR